jgi:hypothetical protein
MKCVRFVNVQLFSVCTGAPPDARCQARHAVGEQAIKRSDWMSVETTLGRQGKFVSSSGK